MHTLTFALDLGPWPWRLYRVTLFRQVCSWRWSLRATSTCSTPAKRFPSSATSTPTNTISSSTPSCGGRPSRAKCPRSTWWGPSWTPSSSADDSRWPSRRPPPGTGSSSASQVGRSRWNDYWLYIVWGRVVDVDNSRQFVLVLCVDTLCW